jgi:hypothetical protein
MLRSLGKTGLEIAPLVFGGNVLGWTIDEKTSFQVLDAFIDHCFNVIDTADVYSAWGAWQQGWRIRNDYWQVVEGARLDVPRAKGFPSTPAGIAQKAGRYLTKCVDGC